jgi:hypothetical protein
MAGAPQYIRNDSPDPRFNSAINTSIGTTFAESNGKSSNNVGNYMRTKQGIFNGAFGSRRSNLTIESGGILDITQDSTSDIPIRRVIHINPFSGTTDTLIGLETDGIELPYQELIIIGVAGDTITVTHDSGGVSGTERAILCPGDTDYTLSGDEVMYLIYDTSLSKWIVTSGNGTGGSGDDLGNHTAIQDLDLNGYDIDNAFRINGSSSRITFSSGSLTLAVDTTDTFALGTASEFTTYKKFAPSSSGIDLGDTTSKWGDIYFQSGLNNSKIYLDGGGDTYITGSGLTGRINHFADGSIIFYTDPTTSTFNSNLDLNGDLDLNSNDLLYAGSGNKLGITSNTVIASISSTEIFRYNINGLFMKKDIDMATGTTIDWTSTQSTVGSAGGASALPATPTGYVIMKVNGIEYVMPYYAKT